MKYCISYRRVHTRFMVTYVLFPLQSSLRAWSHKHGVILSRWKHEPLKARLYLLRDRESVDKFASFKLIDLVGFSIILEQFGSTLMEIISLPLILFFSIHISISIIFPQFSISNSYPRFRLEIRNFIRDLFQINQYRDESRFTLFGKFRSIVSESNFEKSTMNFFSVSRFFKRKLAVCYRVTQGGHPWNFDPFNPFSIFTRRKRNRWGRGEKKRNYSTVQIFTERRNWEGFRVKSNERVWLISVGIGSRCYSWFVERLCCSRCDKSTSQDQFQFSYVVVPDGFDDFLEFAIIREREGGMNYHSMNGDRWKIV